MSQRFLYHLAFWTLYVLYKSFLNIDSEHLNLGQFALLIKIQLVFIPLKMLLVYSLFYVTNQYFRKHWSISKTTFSVCLLFITAVFGIILLNQLVVIGWILGEKISITENITSIQSIGYWFFILAFVSGIAVSIKLVRYSIRQKLAEQELLQKKLELELQFLKAQSNPHFLFNTLNNIYGLARKNSDKTADVVMKLSNLLRYMLYETAQQSIEIEKEIQMINDYIELEKLRYSNKLKVTFDHSVDSSQKRITPLLLLPFVENAFKHGPGESRFESVINIHLTLKEEQLFFEIKNSVENQSEPDHQSKIGLNNIKRQLELIYPNHQLSIDQQPDWFCVRLKINLTDGKI
ncbi:MAG: histidine kinase [Bacteroidetes bacterium]|nr:histidine kinase [Bacteroidota bacterium]